jgi:hypothetical protein
VLAFALPAELRTGLDSALLVADLKDASPAELHPSVAVTINGQPIGRMPEHDAVLPDAADWSEWTRRALAVPATALVAGDNTLKLELESGAYLDRVELELRYAAPTGASLFADGFEGGAGSVVAKGWRNPDSGRLALALPLVPIDADSPLHQCRD